MSEKILNARIQLKYDSPEKWENSSFVPNKGEIIVYKSDSSYSYPRIKIGNGTSTTKALPFFYETITEEELEEICTIPQQGV